MTRTLPRARQLGSQRTDSPREVVNDASSELSALTQPGRHCPDEAGSPRLLSSHRTRWDTGHRAPAIDPSGRRSSPAQCSHDLTRTPPERRPGRPPGHGTDRTAATPTRPPPHPRTYVRDRTSVQRSAEFGSTGSRRRRQRRRLACGRRPEGAVLGRAPRPDEQTLRPRLAADPLTVCVEAVWVSAANDDWAADIGAVELPRAAAVLDELRGHVRRLVLVKYTCTRPDSEQPRDEKATDAPQLAAARGLVHPSNLERQVTLTSHRW